MRDKITLNHSDFHKKGNKTKIDDNVCLEFVVYISKGISCTFVNV